MATLLIRVYSVIAGGASNSAEEMKRTVQLLMPTPELEIVGKVKRVCSARGDDGAMRLPVRRKAKAGPRRQRHFSIAENCLRGTITIKLLIRMR